MPRYRFYYVECGIFKVVREKNTSETWVIMEDQSLVTNLRTNIANKGRAQFSQQREQCFFTAVPLNQQEGIFLHLILVSCEDIIGELLAEKILGYCGHILIPFKSSVDL